MEHQLGNECRPLEMFACRQRFDKSIPSKGHFNGSLAVYILHSTLSIDFGAFVLWNHRLESPSMRGLYGGGESLSNIVKSVTEG